LSIEVNDAKFPVATGRLMSDGRGSADMPRIDSSTTNDNLPGGGGSRNPNMFSGYLEISSSCDIFPDLTNSKSAMISAREKRGPAANSRLSSGFVPRPSSRGGTLAVSVTDDNQQKMNRQKINIIIGLYILVLTSCKTTQTSMIIADNYNEKKNQTTLTLLPYGNIVIPNKWTKTSYDQSSRQHFFTNNDSTTVSVTKNPKNKYPFFKPEQPDKEFVTDFVKWDAEYWEKQGLTVTTVDNQSEKGYILWQAKSDEKNVNTIFLFGSKNGFAYNFSGTSKTWTETRIMDFLVQLFIDN